MVTADAPLPELPPLALGREPWASRMLSGLGAAVDGSVLRAMQLVVERALIPDAENVNALRESARAMLDPQLQRDPGRFFARPGDEAGALRFRVLRSLQGGSVRECRFESGYQPRLAGAADAGRSPILFEHWQHSGDRARGTVVALHGFTMGRPRFDAFALFAGQWFRRGLDVALVTLPYHGVRTPPTARFSGEHFAVPDVARLSEAVREAIWEIQLVTRRLRQESGRPVGLLGLSLGGYLTALAAALCDDLDFAIPMVPPVCIGDLAWGFFEQTRHAREGGEAALSRDELRRSFRVHSPLAHPLRTPRERVLIVAGRGDRIVPPTHPTALWAHWGEPAIHWFSGSHLAPFGRGRIVDAIGRHLASLGIL
jgi:dienelactone hydrolase